MTVLSKFSARPNDKDVVLAAVAQNGDALKYAAASLQKDKDVVLAAAARELKARQGRVLLSAALGGEKGNRS